MIVLALALAAAQPGVCLHPEVEVVSETAGKAVFAVRLDGKPKKGQKYKWVVSEGRIVSGEGAERIVVEGVAPGGSVTASVEVLGLPPHCLPAAHATAYPR